MPGKNFQELLTNHLTLLRRSSLSLTPDFSQTHIASLLEANNALSIAVNHGLTNKNVYCPVDSVVKSFYHL